MKTAVDQNETPFERMKRQAFEWLEKRPTAPLFIHLALNQFKSTEPQPEPKEQSAEEVLDKYLTNYPWKHSWKHWGRYNAILAMQEYAEQYHREKMREELISFANYYMSNGIWDRDSDYENDVDEYLNNK